MTEGPGQEEPASSPASDAPPAEGHQQEAMTTRERALVRGTYIFSVIVLVGVVVWAPSCTPGKPASGLACRSRFRLLCLRLCGVVRSSESEPPDPRSEDHRRYRSRPDATMAV